MDLLYFILMVCVICLKVTCVTIGLFWLLQRIMKSAVKVDLHGPWKYTPQEPYSFLYSNPSPSNSCETHVPNLIIFHHLPPHPYHEYNSSPISLDHRLAGHLRSDLVLDPGRVCIPVPFQDIYTGCPISGIYSQHISMPDNEWYENGFGGPASSLDGCHGERSWQYGCPTCGGGLTQSETPAFSQCLDDDVDANEKSCAIDDVDSNEKSYAIGIKACGCECTAHGVGKDAPADSLPDTEWEGLASISHDDNEWYENGFGGPTPSLDGLWARHGERSWQYGCPTCGGGLAQSETPAFSQCLDDDVDANEKSCAIDDVDPNEKSYAIGIKACGCECSAHGVGKDAPADSLPDTEWEGLASIPDDVFEEFIEMNSCLEYL